MSRALYPGSGNEELPAAPVPASAPGEPDLSLPPTDRKRRAVGGYFRCHRIESVYGGVDQGLNKQGHCDQE